MEIFQILIGSMFSLIAMCTVLYIGFRAHTIAGDLAEIKELLKTQHRPVAPESAILPLERAVAKAGHAPGDWPSVMDPDYNADASTAPKPSE